MQDSGKPEDAGTAEPEGARIEETRESISRRRGSKRPGKPGSSTPEAKPEDEAREETQSVVGRSNREERSARETESSSTGGTEEREVRGNSNIRCRYSRKMQGLG